jgi:hypothetical protein
MVRRIPSRSSLRHGEIRRHQRESVGNRGKGIPNKVPKTVHDVVPFAAAQVGEDGRGKDGLVGYLRRIARTQPKLYAPLLARALDYQTTVDDDEPTEIVYKTVEEVVEELRKRGISIERLRDSFDSYLRTHPEREESKGIL